MRKEERQIVNKVLLDVLQIERSERQKFLDEAGISPEIRAEVESLLALEQESENFLTAAASNFSLEFFLDDEKAGKKQIGQNFGVYRAVSELGYGGMGAVYLAERTDGQFEQKVALKLLKREMNTAALRRRFEQERAILASLDHPNIARLLDAGTTEDRIPFIAMEYVEGLPIDEYCNKNYLNLTQRLDLFRKVCAAVGFAHRNLVIHRDLKPSNILVTEDGVPKLLDFGISKILSTDFEQADSATVTRLGVMTPGYASPEQLRGESVSTATDIYSLGVILYELLSGRRPFESKENDFKEIYRAVLEDDPAPPSSVINTNPRDFKPQADAKNGNGQAETEATKQVRPDTGENRFRRTIAPHIVNLNRTSLRGDLDNIVLKTLRKEPERRYSSAENLAEDIERYQKGLPVSARPNTFFYRAEKFFKRNRVSVAAAVLILLAVITGIIATLWQARVAQAERAKAEKRFNDVRKLANSYLFEIFPEIEDLEGSLKAREKIIKTALEYLDSLSQEAEGDLELQLELATAYEKIGEVQGAVNIPNLGDINAGLESYKKAQRLREAVFAVDPSDAKNKEALARNYQVTAQTLMWNIDTALAAGFFEKAVRLRRELVAENSASPDQQNRLAVLLSDYASIFIENVENEKASALLDESAAIIREVLKNDPDHFYTRKAYPRVLRAYSKLKINTGDFEGAVRDIDESASLTAELVKLKPEDYSLQRTVWLNDFHYCEIFAARRDGPKTVEACGKTLDFNLKTLEKQPEESYALFDLAVSRYHIALGYRLSDQPERAIEFAQKALEPLARLNQKSPDINDYLRAMSVAKREIADSLLMLGKTDEAFAHLEDARQKLEKTVAADKTVTSYKTELARVYRSLAAAFHKKGEKAKAVESADKALEIIKRLGAENRLKETDKNLASEIEIEKSIYEK
jgi:serine/threonine protein kinase